MLRRCLAPIVLLAAFLFGGIQPASATVTPPQDDVAVVQVATGYTMTHFVTSTKQQGRDYCYNLYGGTVLQAKYIGAGYYDNSCWHPSSRTAAASGAASVVQAAVTVKTFYIYTSTAYSGTYTCKNAYTPGVGAVISQSYSASRGNWQTICRVVYNTNTPQVTNPRPRTLTA